MSFYIIHFIIFLILVTSFDKIKNYFFLKNLIYFVYLVLPFGLRGINVGTDTNLYSGIFSQLGSTNFNSQSTTPIIDILSKIIFNVFEGNYSIYLFIVSCFIIGNFMIGISIIDKKIVGRGLIVFYLLYYYIQAFNINRQYLAVSICFVAFCYAAKYRKKLFPFILIFIAIGIHNTAFISLPFLFLMDFKWSKIKYFFCLLVLVGLTQIEPLLLSIFANHFSHYELYTEDSSIKTVSAGNTIYLYVFCILLLISFQFLGKKYLQQNSGLERLLPLSLIGNIMGLFVSSEILVSRLVIYLLVTNVVLFPYAIKALSDKYRWNRDYGKALFCFLIYAILWIPFFLQLQKNIGGVIPYSLFSK